MGCGKSGCTPANIALAILLTGLPILTFVGHMGGLMATQDDDDGKYDVDFGKNHMQQAWGMVALHELTAPVGTLARCPADGAYWTVTYGAGDHER